MPHIHWVARGTGTPKDRDEGFKREVCECDGWVCDLDVMGASSKLSVIRKAAALVRARPTLLLSCWAKAARRKWASPLVDCASWTPENFPGILKNKSFPHFFSLLDRFLRVMTEEGNEPRYQVQDSLVVCLLFTTWHDVRYYFTPVQKSEDHNIMYVILKLEFFFETWFIKELICNIKCFQN